MNISLALGGGGIRGVAHLGVLQALEEHGCQIKAAAGCSAGGITAAVYAAGWRPEEIIEKFRAVDQEALFSVGGSGSVLSSPTILGNEGIREILEYFLRGKTFEDLEIPCAVNAVNMETLEEVILQKGGVLEAVLATIAIPGVFPPQSWEGADLVDGGVLDPVPVGPARSLAQDLPVVAVSISPPPEHWERLQTMDRVIQAPVLNALSNLVVGESFNYSVRSIEVMNHMLAKCRLEADPPAVLIEPDVSRIGALDTVEIDEVVAEGVRAVDRVLPQLDKLG